MPPGGTIREPLEGRGCEKLDEMVRGGIDDVIGLGAGTACRLLTGVKSKSGGIAYFLSMTERRGKNIRLEYIIIDQVPAKPMAHGWNSRCGKD